MIKLRSKILLLFFVIALLSAAPRFVFAETQTAEQIQLQSQLRELEKQILQYRNDLTTIAGQKNTLKNKIAQLQKEQAAMSLQVKATSLLVNNLLSQSVSTQKSIHANIEKQLAIKDHLTSIILSINESDRESLFFKILSQRRFSDIYAQIEDLTLVTNDLHTLLAETKRLNEELDRQKDKLAKQQDETGQLLTIQILQKQEVVSSANVQKTILQETKGKESTYQAGLKTTQAQVKAIQNRLYQLLDVPTQLTFGEALKIANWVSSQTGVRAAFVLSILTQESNLGRNVGTCNRKNDPPEKGWRVVMKPTRDQAPFEIITKDLGLNTDTTPVSCPMRDKKGNHIGWGGAMGPAQFIPSTWMGYTKKVTAITGKTANPWDIKDAFLASGIKLKSNGAGTVAGEWAAAMMYFSGSTNTRFRFYGDNVVARANQYQSDIDALK